MDRCSITANNLRNCQQKAKMDKHQESAKLEVEDLE